MLTLWINSETNALLPNWNAFGTTTLPQIKQGDAVEFEIHWVKSDPAGQFMEEVIMPPSSVVKVAVGVANGGPTDGYFVYSFEGDTVNIPYDATEEDANTLINSIPSISSAGGVTVSLVNQRTYRISFNQVGARTLSSCDSTTLIPSTNVSVIRINAGSLTTKEVQHLRPKLLPVAYSESFTNSPEPVISITDIDSITKRISISPSPKFGTFTISNGTGTTSALSINSSAGDISAALVSSGISSSSRTYSVAKSGDYSWDIYRTSGTSETLSITTNGLIGFSSKVGVVDFKTLEVEDLLGGQATASAVIEIEYSYGSTRQTIYQGRVVIANDLIDESTYNPIPFPEVGGGIEEAPIDGTKYARKDGAWVSFTEEDNQGITQSAGDTRYAQQSNNLSDLDDASQARTNLNVYSTSQIDSALSGKANTSHTHTITDVTGLQTALSGKSDIGHNHNFFQLEKVDGSAEPSTDLDGSFLRVYNGGAGGGNNFAVPRESNSWVFPLSGQSMPSVTITGTWAKDDGFGNASSGTVTISVSFSKYIFRLNTGFVEFGTRVGQSMHSWTQTAPQWSFGTESYGDTLSIYADDSSEVYTWTYQDSVEGISASASVYFDSGNIMPSWSEISFTSTAVNYEFSKNKSNSYDEPVVKRGLLPSLIQELIREKAFSFSLDSSSITKYGLLWDSSTGRFGLDKTPYALAGNLELYAPLAGATFTGKVNIAASDTSRAGLNIPAGSPPTTPMAGDFWFQTGGNYLYYRSTASSNTLTMAVHQLTNTFTAPQIIATTSNTLAALRVTQNGSFPAIVIEDSNNPDSDATIIDANGNVGIGVSNNPATPWTADAKLAVKGSTTLALLRLTQTGSGNVLLVEDEATPDATPFVIGPDGRVGIGGSVSGTATNKLAIYNGNIILTSGFGLIFGSGSTQTVPYIPSAVAITGGTIDNVIIDGGTF